MMHINSNSSGTCIGLMLGMHLCFGDGSKLGKENDLPSKTKLRIKCDHFTLKREYRWNSHTKRFHVSHGGYNLY